MLRLLTYIRFGSFHLKVCFADFKKNDIFLCKAKFMKNRHKKFQQQLFSGFLLITTSFLQIVVPITLNTKQHNCFYWIQKAITMNSSEQKLLLKSRLKLKSCKKNHSFRSKVVGWKPSNAINMTNFKTILRTFSSYITCRA